MKNNQSSTAKSKTNLDSGSVIDSFSSKKMRLELLKQKYNLKELTIPIKRIDHETKTTIKIEAVDVDNDDETVSVERVEPISDPSNGQKELDQEDEDENENDEELSKLEQMFSLNEFTFSVEVAPKCNDVSAEDGPKRTRSGRLIKTTSKFPSEAENQTATTASLIDTDGADGKSSDGMNSENSETESESESGTEAEGETESDDPDPAMVDHRCDICDKFYCRKSYLKKHKETVHCKKEERPQFKCELCGKTLSSKSRLEEHKKSHEETYVTESLSCSTCSKIFKTKINLKYHKLQVHSADSKFKCTVPNCSYGAQVRSRLELHMAAVHSDVRLFLCDECPHASKSAGNLKQHKKHLHPVSKDHICCICGKDFAVRSLLVAHEKTHGTLNEGDASPETCDSCGSVFTSALALKSHKRIHDREMDISNEKDNATKNTENSDMKFPCRYCSLGFAFLSTMKLHARRVHSDKFRFKCDQCPFGTPTFSSMENHKLANHQTGRPFKCQTCGNCFRTPRDLNKHVKAAHPVSKDHVCSECGKAFAHKTPLILHQFRAHKIPKPVSSSATSSQPAPNSSLQADRAGPGPGRDHGLTFHNDGSGSGSGTEQGIYEAGHDNEHEKSDVAPNRVRCPVCRKYFVSEENLEKHKLKMHAPRKVGGVEVDEPERVEFHCEECPSIFSAKRNLVIHMKGHDENYAKNHLTCSICKKVFSSEQGLKRHSHKDVPSKL